MDLPVDATFALQWISSNSFISITFAITVALASLGGWNVLSKKQKRANYFTTTNNNDNNNKCSSDDKDDDDKDDDDKDDDDKLTSSSSASSSSLSSITSLSTPIKEVRSESHINKRITWKELKEHTTEDDCWIALHGKVYNVTNFAREHPGGKIIYEYAGRNATDEFDAFHLPRVKRRLPAYCIGTLVDGPKELPSTRDYRELKTMLWDEGWFEADLSYYARKDVLALCILMFGVGLAVKGQSMLVRTILGGSVVGLALQQVAFVAHDAGHRGIIPPTPGGGINWIGWFHGAVCFGVSIEMWVDEHSGHHAMTMRPHEDPQFKYLPIFLISEKELDRFKEISSVEQAIAKLLVPFQHFTMIPISVIIGRFNLHLISLIYALKAKKFYDVCGILLYFTWFGTITSLLPSNERVAFVLVSYIVAGILHVQLTISHLATDSFTAEEDEKEQFFAFQCKTTRNIDSTWWDDWFHGGKFCLYFCPF